MALLSVYSLVSLKQALAAQGFKCGSRGDTEWSQWVQSEKENLAAVMGRHGIEWEHKGTHEKHLSVLDYKKQEREKEVIQLEGADFGEKRGISSIVGQGGELRQRHGEPKNAGTVA